MVYLLFKHKYLLFVNWTHVYGSCPHIAFIFGHFKLKCQFLNQINGEKFPSSIQCRDSNTQPSGHGSSPLTTRPGLPPNSLSFCFGILYLFHFFLFTSIHVTSSVTRKISPNFYKSCPKMISLKNDKFLHHYKNCLTMWGDLGKLIVGKGCKKLPKVQ